MTEKKKNSLKIEKQPLTLREMALERMRSAIVSGHFKSGDRLVERQLCDELGVSRSIIREVIRYLEAEELVEILPNKGPIVAQMDWPLAEQIYELRMLLESNAAYHCAEIADDRIKSQLASSLKKLESAYNSGNATDLYESTTEFYRTIFNSCGQTVAWDVVQRLNGRISRLRAMTLGTRDRHKEGYNRISQIYAGIVENNPTKASESVLSHIKEAAAIAKSVIEDGSF